MVIDSSDTMGYNLEARTAFPQPSQKVDGFDGPTFDPWDPF
jgi:hypothetical protein